MTSASAVQWRKEVRELLPWWAATVLTMVACWALMHPDAMPTDLLYQWAVLRDRNFLLGVGLCAYAAGVITLGALSLGHEYSHQTMAQLLAQPAPRARLLMVKLVVLAAMLVGLSVLALGAWGLEPTIAGRPEHVRVLLLTVIPLAAGLSLAPWLTMVGRGPLAGAVFTLALSALLWILGTSLQLPASYFWIATALFGVIGALMTRRTFLRLEAAGGHQADVDLSAWLSRSTDHAQARRAHSPVWLLVKKELRLQQATFVVSGLYVVAWLAMAVGRVLGLDTSTGSPLFVATFLNTALVPVLAGALASAEERSLGTADWHNLLPMAAWKQWAIKAGVALGLALALAVVLPTLLAMIATETGWRDGMEPATVLMLCVAALYVSSLCTSGFRALLLTAPAVAITIAAAVVLQFAMLSPQTGLALPAVRWVVKTLPPIVDIDEDTYWWWRRHGWEWAVVGFGVLLLVLGYFNHRTADRSPGRVARQLGWLLAYVLVAGIVVSLVSQLVYHWFSATSGR